MMHIEIIYILRANADSAKRFRSKINADIASISSTVDHVAQVLFYKFDKKINR